MHLSKVIAQLADCLRAHADSGVGNRSVNVNMRFHFGASHDRGLDSDGRMVWYCLAHPSLVTYAMLGQLGCTTNPYEIALRSAPPWNMSVACFRVVFKYERFSSDQRTGVFRHHELE
jgi:hypothetical protein